VDDLARVPVGHKFRGWAKTAQLRREGFAFHDSGKLPGKVLGGAAINVTDTLALY
jgi:hypothetical protein